MKSKIFFLFVGITYLFCFVTAVGEGYSKKLLKRPSYHFSYRYRDNVLRRPNNNKRKGTAYKPTASSNGITLGLKSGFSFNSSGESNLIESSGPVIIKSKKTSTTDNIPFHIDITYPIHNKLSVTISGIFIPSHNIKTVASASYGVIPATIYLNRSIYSYGVMGRVNYELFRLNKFSQYVAIGAGVMMNYINNAELVVDYNCALNTLNRNIVLFNNNNINFAWQLGAGFSYHVTKKISLNAEYLYLDRGKVETKDAFDRTGRNNFEGVLLRSGEKTLSRRLTSHQVLFGLGVVL